MIDYPIPPQELYRIYSDMAADVLDREEHLKDQLPVESIAGVHEHLSGVVDDWESGRKSLRSVPVCNVYATQPGDSPGESLKRLLVGLDASVNGLDDIIDTRELSTRSRIELTSTVAFSSILFAEHCPSKFREEVGDRLREYFTALFQIPLVEKRLFAAMEDARGPNQLQQVAEQIYEYRARDIDGFAHISAIVSELDPEHETRLHQDLRSYRARRLLFKDISDVKRDLEDNDLTPVISLVEHYDSVDDVVDAVENLSSRFSYSERSSNQYSDILRDLESPPSDFRSILRETKSLIDAH